MLGDQALAEIGATAVLYSLITNFAFGMNNGLALTVSRTFRGLSAVSENTSGTA